MKKSFIIKIICLALIICFILPSCTPESSNSGEVRLSSANTVTSDSAGEKWHTQEKSCEDIAKTDYLHMYFDKTTYTVRIKDISENYFWNSLIDTENGYSYAVGVTIIGKSGVYELNSQDNSVALSAAKYLKSDNSITVNYVMSDKKETAQKDFGDIGSDDIYVSLSVSYSLEAQSMTVSVDCSSIKCSSGFTVSCISLLPYFGASLSTSDSDFLFVPDNSGAVMYTKYANEETKNVSVKIYGNDSYKTNEATAKGTMPVFGISQSNAAFTSVITDGDSLATVKADRLGKNTPYKVYSEYDITPVTTDENDALTLYKGNTYDGEISVVYKFLSEDNADYISMASSAREEFIKNDYISDTSHNYTSEMPFSLTLAGSFDNTSLASVQQAQDVLTALKGKGIDNIMLRYKGLFSGGLYQKNLYNSKIQTKLGGYSGLSELYSYMKQQNYKLYLDINIFSSSKKYSSSLSSYNIFGSECSVPVVNDLALEENNNFRLSSRIGATLAAAGADNKSASMYLGEKSYNVYLMKLSKLSDNYSQFLSGKYDDVTDGFSINDAGKILYSDNSINRQNAEKLVSQQTRAAANINGLTVDTGNIYTVYGADIITNMRFDTFYPESEAYVPVPFSQAVLHGYTEYTGKPIDAGDPLYRYDMLQYIEYGAVPSFEWVFDDSSIFYYGYYVLSERMSEIVDFYNTANDILGDLRNQTIVSHSAVTTDADGKALTGVYRTEYSNGSAVYVNYNSGVVTTSDSVVVKPYSCERVDR